MDRSVPACIKIPPEARFEGRYVFCNNSKPPEYFSSDDSSFEDPITSSYPESNEKNQKVGSRHKIQNKLKCSRCRCWKLEKEFINVHDSRIMRTCNSCRRRNKPHASLSKMKKEQEEMLRQLPTDPSVVDELPSTPSCFVPRQEGHGRLEGHPFISRPCRPFLQRATPLPLPGPLGHYLDAGSMGVYPLNPLESSSLKRKAMANSYFYSIPVSAQYESYPPLCPLVRYPFASLYPLSPQTALPSLTSLGAVESGAYQLARDAARTKRDAPPDDGKSVSKLDILAALSKRELELMQEKRQECATMSQSAKQQGLSESLCPL